MPRKAKIDPFLLSILESEFEALEKEEGEVYEITSAVLAVANIVSTCYTGGVIDLPAASVEFYNLAESLSILGYATIPAEGLPILYGGPLMLTDDFQDGNGLEIKDDWSVVFLEEPAGELAPGTLLALPQGKDFVIYRGAELEWDEDEKKYYVANADSEPCELIRDLKN